MKWQLAVKNLLSTARACLESGSVLGFCEPPASDGWSIAWKGAHVRLTYLGEPTVEMRSWILATMQESGLRDTRVIQLTKGVTGFHAHAARWSTPFLRTPIGADFTEIQTTSSQLWRSPAQ